MFVPSFQEYLNCQVNVMIRVLFTRRMRTSGEVEVSVNVFLLLCVDGVVFLPFFHLCV